MNVVMMFIALMNHAMPLFCRLVLCSLSFLFICLKTLHVPDAPHVDVWLDSSRRLPAGRSRVTLLTMGFHGGAPIDGRLEASVEKLVLF